MALLYVDMLGMKARYLAGGVDAARAGYRAFEQVIAEGLAVLPKDAQVGGGVQSDGAVLTFKDTVHAVMAGRQLMVSASLRATSSERVWIRGLVLEHNWPAAANLEKVGALRDGPPGVFVRHFKTPLLHAINLEQSGFRGQRLLIADRLVTEPLREAMFVEVAGRRLALFKRLENAPYPRALNKYQDVLWMLTDDLEDWAYRKIRLLDALRWSARDSFGDAEFVQAAATQLVFAEADAIVHRMGASRASRSAQTDQRVALLWRDLRDVLTHIRKSLPSSGR